MSVPTTQIPAPGSLDHEYNTRHWAQDFEHTLQSHRQWGEAARRLPGSMLDLRWGPRPRQTLDWFAPPARTGPLFIFMHGGYWQYRTSGKEAVSFLAPYFVDRGAAFVAVQYELCPDVTMDEMVTQLREAMVWIARQTSSLGFNPSRTIVGGHSAGAHLAAMMALTRWQDYDLDPGFISAACCISGLYDLRPLISTYLNATLRMSLESAGRVSPIHTLHPQAPSLLLAVGELESGEFKRQTHAFGETGSSRGVQVDTHIARGRDHYNVVRDLIETDTPLCLAATQLVFGRRDEAPIEDVDREGSAPLG